MLEKVFWQDPYLTELDASVVSVNGNDITLDKTIFYAFSGGQESDSGTIGGYDVETATKQEYDIVYSMNDSHDLESGDNVKICIDWKRRYSLMRHHFAAELILEIMYKECGDVQKVGAHIAENKARIDFYWPENISKLFPKLIELSSKVVECNLPITSAFEDESQQKRYWQIDGFAKVPCGGTHLKSTGEVGGISLKRKNIGKGKDRIDIFLTPNEEC
ncbi:MAG: alanyl-tRNA editing protein [Gammaproteobacteria bacterium]|nr:alanyl-tRNA editing protein [Gammaproteobacteria bacterium]